MVVSERSACQRTALIMTNDKKISCNYVSKVYGEHSEKALEYSDSGISQEEFQKTTGHVLAVKDISFDVSKGEYILHGCTNGPELMSKFRMRSNLGT